MKEIGYKGRMVYEMCEVPDRGGSIENLYRTAKIFPEKDESFRLKQLEPPTEKVRMVLVTNTYNGVDDQFALAYAFL